MIDKYYTKIKYQYKSKNDFEWHDCHETEVIPYLKYDYEIRVVQDFKLRTYGSV